MSVRVSESEDLREEVETLRAALAEREKDGAIRDAALADRDEALAAKDEQLVAHACQVHLTQEDLEYMKRRLFGRKSEKMPAGPTLVEGQLCRRLPPPPTRRGAF